MIYTNYSPAIYRLLFLQMYEQLPLNFHKKSKIFISRFIGSLFDSLRHKIACHYYHLSSSSDKKNS